MGGFWIGVAAADHVAIAVREGFAMFAHGRHDAARKLEAGDWVVYYSPRAQMGGGAECRQFTAIGQVAPGEPAERLMAPGVHGWYRTVRWLDARPADVYPLLDTLTFVANRQHWGVYFRKSLFRVGAQDFSRIAVAMGVDPQTFQERS